MRLVKTNGQANEPPKAPLICPMALLESQDGGVAEGRETGGCMGGGVVVVSYGAIGGSERRGQYYFGGNQIKN